MEEENNVPDKKAEEQMEQEDDDDDLDDLGLFHKSSLREKQTIPFPEISPEIKGVKKYLDQNNQSHIGQYIEHENIGRGAFASVIKAERNNIYYAIKIYSLSKLRSQRFFAADGSFSNGEEMFENQIDIIKRIQCDNIVKCHQILHGGTYVYVVNQLCDLGQIMNWNQIQDNYRRNQKVVDYIQQKYKTQKFDDIVRIIFLQISRGLQYMHSRNITNRDIKVDNILCRQTQEQGTDIKIADFTTVRYSKDELSYFISGTPGFRGPQQQFASSDGYNCCATDIWSFGICLYTFFFNKFPFMAETQFQIDSMALNKELQFPADTPEWAKSLINKTTRKNWKQRINISQVIQILLQQ